MGGEEGEAVAEAVREAGGGPVGVSSSSSDSMEKRRLGQPLLLARDEDPGVVAPDGASSRLGMDLDFWIICSYAEMRLGTMSRGTSMPQGAHPPVRPRPPRCCCLSNSRMRVRTERMTSGGSSSARLMRCIFL